MFKRLLSRMFCKHEVWSAPELSVLSAFSEYRFKVQCKRCGKIKKVRGETINGLSIYIKKPFDTIKGD